MSAAATPASTLVIPTRLFGPLEVPSDRLVTFPDGLPGFAGERRFVLLATPSPSVTWLQSADDSLLAFLCVDPFVACPGFELDLPDDAWDAAEPPLVLAIVTLPREHGDAPSANLQAPLLLDLAARSGQQVLLADAGYPCRAPLDLDAELARRA
ncbi:MAG: flagellar assembly protein FliW [Gemmatimonadales bacterium]|nr:flagellar assembly protein FliW [Gemmatimonadales bacterium]